MSDTIERHFALDLLDVIKEKIDRGEPFPYENAKKFIELLPGEDKDTIDKQRRCRHTHCECESVINALGEPKKIVGRYYECRDCGLMWYEPEGEKE